MTRYRVILTAALVVSGAALPLAAQVPAAPGGKVPAAPPAASPGKTLRPSPTLMPMAPTSAVPVAPGAVPPTNQPSPAQGPTAVPRAVVTPQASVTPPAGPPPAPAAPAAATGSNTAGLGLQPFGGGGEASRLEYGRILARNVDSVAVSLMTLYRQTSGQPMAGATGPQMLSGRERDRWTRCRDLYMDFTTFTTGAQSIREGLSPTSQLSRAAAALDTALSEIEALAECDNVASMISAPDRWVPWAEHYSNAARHFYTDWYPQMRAVHEKDRAFVGALNALLPAGQRMAVPPGLPNAPPYAGGVVR